METALNVKERSNPKHGRYTKAGTKVLALALHFKV